MTRLACLLPALLVALAGAVEAGELKALVGPTIIDGTGRAPTEDGVVVIEGQRIRAVGSVGEIALPEGAERIDLRGRWLIPGLIDAHVHFFQSGGLYTRPDVLDLRSLRPYEEELARIRAALDATFARYLAAGITGVFDVGGPMWNFELRARASANPLAPRVAVAGPLLATYAPPALASDDPPILRIRSPEQARAEVRRQLAHDPDAIKIWFVFPREDLEPELTWIRAAVAEADAAGVPVIAHATQHRVAEAVIEAGATLLAHSIADAQIDETLLGRMRARDVVYITTLAVGEGYRRVLGMHFEPTELERRIGDPEVIASLEELENLPRELLPARARPSPPLPLSPILAHNLVVVARGGITVAAGSDAGNIGTLHGPGLHRELELMVEAGLSPMEVLVAATRGGAVAMGRAHELGTLEPGKLADLVVLDADPLADIRNARRVAAVVKGGRMLAHDAILEALRRLEAD